MIVDGCPGNCWHYSSLILLVYVLFEHYWADNYIVSCSDSHRSLVHSITYSLIHSLSHPLTSLFIHSSTHWLTHSLTYLLTHSLSQFTHSISNINAWKPSINVLEQWMSQLFCCMHNIFSIYYKIVETNLRINKSYHSDYSQKLNRFKLENVSHLIAF